MEKMKIRKKIIEMKIQLNISQNSRINYNRGK